MRVYRTCCGKVVLQKMKEWEGGVAEDGGVGMRP